MDDKTLSSTPPIVQRGDRLMYETHTGRIRYVMVIGTDIESNGRPVFDSVVCAGEPEEGKAVWGYFDQVIAIEPAS